jgi:hypothetical protein
MSPQVPARVDDPWEAAVDRIRAREVLDRLGAHPRPALTLRYLDGLPVPEVARHLDRTVHATEALLVRAGPSGRRPRERARAPAVRTGRRLRRRPGHDVPPLAADRLNRADFTGPAAADGRPSWPPLVLRWSA